MALTAYRDATSKNTSSRNAHQYSDLDLFFTRKTSTSDVNKLTDVLAVKRAVRNLVLMFLIRECILVKYVENGQFLVVHIVTKLKLIDFLLRKV